MGELRMPSSEEKQ